ncbi:MAG: hypothetical protein WKF97_04945 [Chitinophagaceae bacterium]
MKKFFGKIFLLLFIVLTIVTICLVLPPGNLSKNYLLFAQKNKNDLLANTPGPRIILVGGSNVSFGINSKILKDSLNLNPVNTALHAGIGLKFMLNSTIDYVRENDIVVLSPEYQQFYGNLSDGQVELLTLLIDVSPQTGNVNFRQFVKLLSHIPKYSSSKLRLWNYFKKADTTTIGIYDRKSFNAYGDAYVHWTLPKVPVMPFDVLKGNLNEDAFNSLLIFREKVQNRKAQLFITFPCCQDISFKHSIVQIKKIEKRLRAEAFILLGTPERYIFPDSLTFNTPYHLIKKGVDQRTALLAEDLKKHLWPFLGKTIKKE